MKAISTLTLSLLAMLLGSCSTDSTMLSKSGLTYPRTQIALHGGYALEHEAGSPSMSGKAPLVGFLDAERTKSKWSLNQDGKKVGECGSFLSDPRFHEGLEEYYRENDEVIVYQTKSGKTVVVAEDRSPTFHRKSFLVFRMLEDQSWTSFELKPKDLPVFNGVPEIEIVTDQWILLRGDDQNFRYKFSDKE